MSMGKKLTSPYSNCKLHKEISTQHHIDVSNNILASVMCIAILVNINEFTMKIHE